MLLLGENSPTIWLLFVSGYINLDLSITKLHAFLCFPVSGYLPLHSPCRSHWMTIEPWRYCPLSSAVSVALLFASLFTTDSLTFKTGRVGIMTLPIKPTRRVSTLTGLRGSLLLKLWFSARSGRRSRQRS